MKVRFYGHICQYRNIKDEIDKNISGVFENGSYVMGPMISRFEEKLPDMQEQSILWELETEPVPFG